MRHQDGDYPVTYLISTADLPLSHVFPTEGADELLDRLYFRTATETYDEATETTRLNYGFVTDPEVVFELPGLGGMAIVAGGATNLVDVELVGSPNTFELTVGGGLSLRFPREWLKPVTRVDGRWEDDPSRDHVELEFGGGVTIDRDFEITFEGTNEFTIEPAMIGDTGLVIEGTVAVDLSESSGLPESQALGLDPTWRGVVFKTLELHLPDDLDVPGAPSDLLLEDFHIGGGGITGTISGEWASGLSGELFGMEFALHEVDIEFFETALVGTSVKGAVTLPFFDRPVDLHLGIAGDGTITAALDDPEGLVTVDHDAFSLEIDGLEFSTEGIPAVSLSGTITPKLIPDAPGVRTDELRIDSDGNVHVEGGWLDVPDQYSIDFYGFAFEITAFGIGRNDDGSKWIGLNGGIKFVDELSAGASVKGLRVTWFDEGPHAGDAPTVSFEGVGVELEVPDAVQFKGEVSYTERTLSGGGTDNRFEGAIELDLLALDITVDGSLVVGTRSVSDETYTYCAVYLGADIPTGIPLFSTGLALYGFSGLYAQNMAPALESGEEWFTRAPEGQSWYHRDPAGATDFGGTPSKWPAERGAFALGAGVTLGTASDNGYAFSGNLLLVIAFPGPVVMLNGESTILSPRSELDSGDPNFSSLAVLDGRAGTFTFGLDAQYRYGDGGELVDIGASIQAFYALNDPTAWYVYIGRKEPREERVRATLFSLFEANGYVMLDPRQLAMGAWYGYDEDYSFGPLGVDIEAWISGDAVLTFQPAHFSGVLAARGAVRLRAFGFNAGISLDASIAAEVFDPFHLLGKFRVALELPGFLPDPSATVTLEWGPRKEPPTLPEPLKEVAISHELGTTTWPLELGGSSPPSEGLPVVPLDGRPELTFAMSVHDDGFNAIEHPDSTPNPIGESPNEVDPKWARIGDPTENEGPVKVRYGLGEVRIERKVGGNWEAMPDTYGSWAPVPTLPEGDRTEGKAPPMANTKLTLLTPNPFDYVRHTGGKWGDTVAEREGDYPCLYERDCWDFDGLTVDDFSVGVDWSYGIPTTRIDRDDSAEWPTFRYFSSEQTTPVEVEDVMTADGPKRALSVGYESPPDGSAAHVLIIDLPEPRASVKVRVAADKHCDLVGLMVLDGDTDSTPSDAVEAPTGVEELVITAREGEMSRVAVAAFDSDTSTTTGTSALSLFSVCASDADLENIGTFADTRDRSLREQVARLGDEGSVFDPYSTYRVVVQTTTQARGLGDFDWYEEDRVTERYAYFRTDGPPALADLSVPVGGDPETFDSGLTDLTQYVAGTVPETVAKRGERPTLPRPVYRAYDVGTRFTRNYVDSLYWRAERDLALILFDRNNEPARSPDGRLHIAANQWGKSEMPIHDVAERQWLRAIDRGECVGLDERMVARVDLLDATVGLGVLAPDEVYEARLVPRLLRETFGATAYYDGSDPWTVHDMGGRGHDWSVVGHEELDGSRAKVTGTEFDLQSLDPTLEPHDEPRFVDADLSGVEADSDVVRFAAGTDQKVYRISAVDTAAGTIEVDGSPSFEQSRWQIPGRGVLRQGATGDDTASIWVRDDSTGVPAQETWTDYRIATTVTLEADESAAGVVVRRDPDTGAHVRYVLDGDSSERRLVFDDGSEETILARDEERAVVSGRPYDVEIEAVGHAYRMYEDGVLVFADDFGSRPKGGVGLFARGRASFGEIRVDDVSTDAPVAYNFEFTTSQYANVAHHIGSYADETWTAEATAELSPTQRVALSDATTSPSTDEARAYEASVASLNRPTGELPTRVETTVIRRDGRPRAILIESPEPFDWTRTTLDVAYAASTIEAQTPATDVKVTDVIFGDTDDEVGVLVGDDVDLAGHSVEFRQGGSGYTPSLVEPAFTDYGDDADTDLSAYSVPSDGTWRRVDGTIECTPNGAATTLAVADSFPSESVWHATFDARRSNTIGVAFRIVGNRGYRFTVGPAGRQLIRYDGSTERTLWMDSTVVPEDEPLSVRVEADDETDTLSAFVDDVAICVVEDPGGAPGSFGAYVDGDDPVTVVALDVHDRAYRPTLFAESFEDGIVDGWSVVDEPPETTRTSDWVVVDGTLTQRSNIYGFHGDPFGEPGTFLVSDETFSDGRVTVRLRSDDDDAIGLMVRCVDDENYYRFSMDSERSYRRFDRQIDGVTIPLWRDEVAFEPGREYVFTLDCEGDQFTGYLDGVELFSVRDDSLAEGSIALYCRANVAANFHDVRVDARADQWVTYHEFEGQSLPAGTQLRLHRGSTPSRTGAGIRAVPVSEVPSLPPTGAEFRILGPDDTHHERWVTPASAFRSLSNVALTRRLDGTGFLLFAGTDLEPGTYRLDVEYSRRGDVTFRQNGDDSSERATLDIVVR